MCAKKGSGGRFRKVPEDSGVCWCRFQRQVPEGSGVCAGVSSGGRFQQVLEGSGGFRCVCLGSRGRFGWYIKQNQLRTK